MSKFKISISSSIVEEFGRNLYDSVPPVLAEIVANAYDADASRVEITIEKEADRITIVDDGCGMSVDDINAKFLKIGVRKRPLNQTNDACTPKFKRLYMGRKGVGKLAIFAIADSFTVESIPKDDLDSRNGFKFDQTELLKNSNLNEFELPEVPCTLKQQGTKIIIEDVKENKRYDEDTVRYIISRRFPLLDENFKIFVNDKEVSWDDNKGLISKFEYIFYFGAEENFQRWEKLFKQYNPKINIEKINIDGDSNPPLSGWIACVKQPSDLQYKGFSSNNISVIVRKKMAQEDILKSCSNNRHSLAYMSGLVFADFLDKDDAPDLSTASRQNIKESEKFDDVLNYSRKVINKVSDRWSELRQEREDNKIKAIPAIQEWLKDQQSDKEASELSQQYIKYIGKVVTSLNVSKDTNTAEEVATLCEGAILSYEHAKRSQTVKKLVNEISVQNSDETKGMFAAYVSQYNRYISEAFFPIIEERLDIIKTLENYIANKNLEKDFQHLIHKNLWIVRPLWENLRYTVDTIVKNKLEEHIQAEIGGEEVTGRIDISIGNIDRNPVIIELKKCDIKPNVTALNDQITKYRKFVSNEFNVINSSKQDYHPIIPKDVITYIILGEYPRDWADQDVIRNGWAATNVYVLNYSELLYDAKTQYHRYIEENSTANKVIKNIKQIREDVKEAFEKTK